MYNNVSFSEYQAVGPDCIGYPAIETDGKMHYYKKNNDIYVLQSQGWKTHVPLASTEEYKFAAEKLLPELREQNILHKITRPSAYSEEEVLQGGQNAKTLTIYCDPAELTRLSNESWKFLSQDNSVELPQGSIHVGGKMHVRYGAYFGFYIKDPKGSIVADNRHMHPPWVGKPPSLNELSCSRDKPDNPMEGYSPENSPSYILTQYGHDALVKYVESKNADVTSLEKDSNGEEFENILHVAAGLNCIKSIEYLVDKKGVDVNIQNCLGLTPLHYAVERGGSSKDTLKSLLKRGADLNIPDEFGATPVHQEVEKSLPNKDALKLMAKYGADFNQKDKFGFTPKDLIAEKENSAELLGIVDEKKALLDKMNNKLKGTKQEMGAEQRLDELFVRINNQNPQLDHSSKTLRPQGLWPANHPVLKYRASQL